MVAAAAGRPGSAQVAALPRATCEKVSAVEAKVGVVLAVAVPSPRIPALF